MGRLINPDTGELAPPKVQKAIKEDWFKKAIKKGLNLLEE